MNFEKLFIYFLLGGVVVLVLGHVAMIVQGFRQSRGWGFATLLLGPIGTLAFTVKYFRQAIPGLALGLIGLILVGLAYYPAIFGEGVKKDPVVRVEKGDVQLTVTDAENFDYATLRDYTNLSMLQMANANVTDQTLEYVREMKKLKNLDISKTSITDDGLKFIGELPALEELRLANTKITDKGFREHLMGINTLKKLDLTGTAISKDVIDEWRKGQPGRRALK